MHSVPIENGFVYAALFATLAVSAAILQLADVRKTYVLIIESVSIVVAVWALREHFLDMAIAAAALLPVIGSGIRGWRSANEATRNISRFRAKHLALCNIMQRLNTVALQDDVAAADLLRDLWCAEQIMESEHREWLRLMTEAEWLG